MGKLAVIYWSGTGNTEAMAVAIADGAKQAGSAVDVMRVEEITPDAAAAYDKVALGCPAMGAEVLEEESFEPFFTQLEEKLSQKKVALFGSYGWGDGQWMRDWQDRVIAAGGTLFRGEGLILNEMPDAAGLDSCKEFGAEFANS